jgi:hypothetical protein
MPSAPATKDIGNPELIAVFEQTGLLERDRAAKKAFKRAEAEKKAVAEEIKVTLREHGQSKLKNGQDGWSISYSMSNGKKSISKQAIIDAGLDPEDFMTAGNPYEILRVTYTDMTEDDV